MLSDVVRVLADPYLVARFQRWCGVEQVRTEEAPTVGCHDRWPVKDSNHHTATRLPPRPTDDNTNRGYHAPRPADTLSPNNNVGDVKTLANGVAVNGVVHGVPNGYVDSHCDGRPVSNGVGPKHTTTTLPEKCQSNGVCAPSERLRVSSPPDPPSSLCPPPSPRVDSGVCERRCRPNAAGGDEKSNVHEQGSTGEEEGSESPTRVVIRYRVLYYWALVGATLGNEVFYLTGMPFLLWTVDSAIIRQTAVLWWLVMYVGQAFKDYLGWLRPPSPPVIRLETTHLAEFSMPSTHAMSGTAVPLLLYSLVIERYELPVVPVLLVALLWCATTCLSRLYLGVHTVLDVVCGVLLSLALFAIFSPLIPRYDHYQQTHPLAPFVLLATSLALCTVCYPSNSKHSAKGDAIIITAVVVGVGIGAWLNYHLGLSVETPQPVRMPVSLPTLSWFGKSLLQFVVGVAVVFALKAAVKPLMVRFFCAFFGLDRVETQHSGVMVGYKYTTYLCLGLAMIFLDPLLFTALGFGRPGYYREVV